MDTGYDILIIGGGIAGASAALTAKNRGKAVAVITNGVETSSLYKAEAITNYPGLPSVTGEEFSELLRAQTVQKGVTLISGRALSVIPMGGSFGVAVGGDFYSSRAVIIAAGITREKLYPGEAEFLGRGVSYCATCDGMLYRGKTVAVVGSGKEAEEDAEFLRGIGCTVHHISQPYKFEIRGGDRAEKLVYGGEELRADCVFIVKDTVSVTQLSPGLEYRDGGIATDRAMGTAVPGIFAAGDCTGKPYQLAKAAGEGNIAALSACEYIDRQKK